MNMGASQKRLAADAVLVTGPPRSGTTAVGSVLNYAKGTISLHEPMNYHTGDKVIPRYFAIPGDPDFSTECFFDLADRIATAKLSLRSGIFPGEPTWRKALKSVVGGRSVQSLRRAKLTRNPRTVIWKDPFAVFCLAELERFENLTVVVCYRPPLAVAGSFKRVEWGFSHFDVQNSLDPRYHLSTPGIVPDTPLSPAQRGALFWAVSYGYLLEAARRSPRVKFLDVGAVVGDPVATYRRVYDFGGLPFTAEIEARIRRRYRSAPAGSKEVPGQQVHTSNRDIGAVNRYWEKILDPDEIDWIRHFTGELEERIAVSGVFV